MKKIIVLLFLITLTEMSHAQDFKKVHSKLLLQKYEAAKDEYEEIVFTWRDYLTLFKT